MFVLGIDVWPDLALDRCADNVFLGNGCMAGYVGNVCSLELVLVRF